MREIVMGIMTAVMGMATIAHAQVGLTEAEFTKHWGKVISRDESAPRVLLLTFKRGDLTVEAACLKGIVRRIVYRKPNLARGDVQELLKRNQADCEWDEWIPPGRRVEPGGEDTWMRSDEMVMASMGNGQLIVISGKWNLRDREQPESGEKPVAAAAHPTVVPAPPRVAERGPASEVAGYWAAVDDSERTLALHIEPGGGTIWVVFGKYEKREINLSTTAGAASDLPTFLLVAEDGKQTLGSLRLTGGNSLRFLPEADTAGASDTLTSMRGRKAILFGKRPGFPRWRAKPRDNMPVVGDSRERVIELLGNPLGAFKAGKSEALQYEWGQVVVRDGTVVAIE